MVTRIIRKFILNFLSKKVEIDNAKVVFLLELVVIIIESWYNQAYIFLIIELWSPISTFLVKKLTINNFSENSGFLTNNNSIIIIGKEPERCRCPLGLRNDNDGQWQKPDSPGSSDCSIL